jgi:hypothetical protein
MKFSEMQAAVNEAKAELHHADMLSNDLAEMLQGRLRKVTRYGLLKRLKAELQHFNASTGRWRESTR